MSPQSPKPCEQTYAKGFPWWSSGGESSCQCKGHRLIPDLGRFHMPQGQLDPWAATTATYKTAMTRACAL